MKTVGSVNSENLNSVQVSKVKTKIIQIAISAKGKPALWESHKVSEDELIRTTIMVSLDGERLSSIFRRNQREKQSLVPITTGDYIVKAFREHDGRIGVSALRILNVRKSTKTAMVKLVLRKDVDQDLNAPETWNIANPKLYSLLQEAIDFSIKKLDDSELVWSELSEWVGQGESI